MTIKAKDVKLKEGAFGKHWTDFLDPDTRLTESEPDTPGEDTEPGDIAEALKVFAEVAPEVEKEFKK